MQQYTYSWHVTTYDPSATKGDKIIVVQVNADEIELHPSGALVFWAHKERARNYSIMIIAPGRWQAAAVQNQITGYQNAFEVLSPG